MSYHLQSLRCGAQLQFTFVERGLGLKFNENISTPISSGATS